MAIRRAEKAELLWEREAPLCPKIAAIAADGRRTKTRNEIHSSGYAVHTMKAALWAVDRADDFESAVLLAANPGDDADTVASATG